MTHRSATPPAPTRHALKLLTLLAVLFIIQTGVVPFDFLQDTPSKRAGEFFSIRTNYVTFPDIVSNIFLYLPLGLLLHATLRRSWRAAWMALVAAVAGAGLLSGAIEWAQAYSPSRVSSLIDVVANVMGATLGALVSLVAGLAIPKLVGALLYEFHARPQLAAVKSYCLLLFVFGAMPFSFSFDSGRVKEAFKKARLIPFARATLGGQGLGEVESEPALSKRGQLALSYQRWSVMKSWSRWAAELLSFAVLAWLFLPLLKDHYHFGRKARVGIVWWTSGLIAVSISGMQFFIVHRWLDTTDILFRLSGAGLGLITASCYFSKSGPWDDRRREHLWRALARGGCVAALAYIVYTGIIPATFDAGRDGPAKSLASTSFLPFFGYFMTRFDVMMDDVLEKLAAYAILGALLAAWLTHLPRSAGKAIGMRVMLAGVVLASMIEVIQMFISVRVTSLTDPIIACAGCAVGATIMSQAELFHAYSRTHDLRGSGAGVPDAEPSRRSPTPDEMLATLAQPHSAAPKEQVPGPRRSRRD